jgi:sulfatase modifying factor 1
MLTAALALAADVIVGPATFERSYPSSPSEARVVVPAFRLDVLPVTEGEFQKFVAENPAWRRDNVPRVKADEGYLSRWTTAATPSADANAPVTEVSWFAARAYCAARHRRLPTEDEWEVAAAASETSRDARRDPSFVRSLLDWYSRPTPDRLPPVGQRAANAWGVKDLHGLVWEWVLDFNSTMITGDGRENGEGDVSRFCGTGALSASDVADYAAFQRFAFRSSLQGSYTTRNLGFRCAADVEGR